MPCDASVLSGSVTGIDAFFAFVACVVSKRPFGAKCSIRGARGGVFMTHLRSYDRCRRDYMHGPHSATVLKPALS